MLKNTTDQYGWIAKLFHWVVALSVFGLFAVGIWMVDLDYYNSWYTQAPFLHKSAGVLLAVIMLCRLIWRIINITPAPLTSHTHWEVITARIAHGLFYSLIFLMVISGYLISTADDRPIDVFGWFEIPSLGSLIDNQADIAGLAHEWLAYLLIALASIHALAALKHHFIDKDTTLKRMI